MSWTTKLPAIKAAFSAIMPSSSYEAVAWEDEARPWGDPILLLKVIASSQESSQNVTTANGNDLDVVHYSVRNFTVQAKVESVFNSASPFALDVADQLKLRTRRASFVEAIEAAGMDLVDLDQITETQVLSYEQDQQVISAYIFDVAFRGLFTDSDPDPTGTIGSVNGSGTINPGSIPLNIAATE